MRMLTALAVSMLVASPAIAKKSIKSGDLIAIQEMTLEVPDGWELAQDAKDDGTIILGFANGSDYLTFYVKADQPREIEEIFAANATVVRAVRTLPRNTFNWQVLETSKRGTNSQRYMASFLTRHNGYTYYGYSRANSSANAMTIVNNFLENIE